MGLFSNDKINELFAFNLMPPKSKSEIEEEAKKKRAFLYSITVPGICLVVAFVLFIINIAVIKPMKQNWEVAVETMRQTLNNPATELGQLKLVNAELTKKTEMIAEPIDKNVDFNKIFQVTEKVFSRDRSSSATSYGREDDGQFIVNGVSTSENGPSKVLKAFKSNSDVEDVILRFVQKIPEDKSYKFSIGFIITAIKDEVSVQDTNPINSGNTNSSNSVNQVP